MHTKLKQHLAIATGAASAAALPMGADAAIVYKDSTNRFSVSLDGTVSHEWDVDGGGSNDFRVLTWTGAGDSYVSITSAGRSGRGFVGPTAGGKDFFNLAAGKQIGSALSTGYAWGGIWRQLSQRSRRTSQRLGRF